jgi:hypothetical protein
VAVVAQWTAGETKHQSGDFIAADPSSALGKMGGGTYYLDGQKVEIYVKPLVGLGQPGQGLIVTRDGRRWVPLGPADTAKLKLWQPGAFVTWIGVPPVVPLKGPAPGQWAGAAPGQSNTPSLSLSSSLLTYAVLFGIIGVIIWLFFR